MLTQSGSCDLSANQNTRHYRQSGESGGLAKVRWALTVITWAFDVEESCVNVMVEQNFEESGLPISDRAVAPHPPGSL